MIALVDYGAGNLTSVRKALTAIGAEFWTPAEASELARAAGVIVPGVGHFSSTARLDHAWRDAVHPDARGQFPGQHPRGVPQGGLGEGIAEEVRRRVEHPLVQDVDDQPVPVGGQARSVVMIEQVAGLMYIALVVSRIVGLMIARQRA